MQELVLFVLDIIQELKTAFGRLMYEKWQLFVAASGAWNIRASSRQMDYPSDRVI